MPPKYAAKICRQNMPPKYAAKICRQNIPGKIFLPNIPAKVMRKNHGASQGTFLKKVIFRKEYPREQLIPVMSKHILFFENNVHKRNNLNLVLPFCP
jgi:hypothetical protein